MKFLLKLLFLSAYLLASCAHAFSPDLYNKVLLEEIVLNRKATNLTSSQKKKIPKAYTGFIWNIEDNNTKKWRPQGIAEITTSDKKFVAITWYGRETKESDYSNRGVRVSFVDITDINSIRYSHMLLVDEFYNTFKGMHAGGLAYRNGKLHVPDTRNETKRIHVFSIDSIKEVPKHDKKNFYDFDYILIKDSSYDVLITPSFISYDWSREQFLIGTFSRKNTKSLQWYSVPYNKK